MRTPRLGIGLDFGFGLGIGTKAEMQLSDKKAITELRT